MPDKYSPYNTRLGRAIERGEGIRELTNQAVFTLGRVKFRAENLKKREGWKDILDIIKDEPFVPFPIRVKLNIAHKVAHDIGFFIKKNPDATAEDVREEVQRLVDEAELDIEETSKEQTEVVLKDQEAVKDILEEIEQNPEAASKGLISVLKRATSIAAHESLKDYSKHASFIVPFPWNINLAIFTATYHVRLAGLSLYNYIKREPIDPDKLEKELYKNHLSRALNHIANGVSDTGGVLIPYLKRVPGIGYLANYVLRNTIGKAIKHTADVLDEDTREIQGSVSAILNKTFHKDSFDKDMVAMTIAMGIDKVTKAKSLEVAKDVAVSYRYSRVSKTINLASEITRATFGYASSGAPDSEKRRANFLRDQGKKEAKEHLRRNQTARNIMRSAHRMPRRQTSLMITPLTGQFTPHSYDRRSSMHVDTRMSNGIIDRSVSSYEADIIAMKDME